MINKYCNRSAPAMLILLASLGLVACGNGPPSDAGLVEGQEPYLRWCASCHGNAGEGKPPAFPPLAESEWLELPDEGLALIVLYGLRGTIEVAGRRYRGYMPPMQHLGDEDIAAILRYVQATWGRRESGLEADTVARLRTARGDRRGPLEGRAGVEAAIGRLP